MLISVYVSRPGRVTVRPSGRCEGQTAFCMLHRNLRAAAGTEAHGTCDSGQHSPGRVRRRAADVDELPIGRRVAYWRGRRRMSQQVFADRLGKSKSWVDKVERGVRRLDKFSVVYEIADVLQVDVQLLLGKDAERRPGTMNCIDQVEVEEIRAALERYDQISAFFNAPPEPPPLDMMRKAVNHAWQTYQHAKCGMLARALPKLLRDAQAADTAYTGTEECLT